MRRLSRRLVAYLVSAALLVVWARRALPTGRLWKTVAQPIAKGSSEDPATFPKLQFATRYSHQVENVPAPKKIEMGNTNAKDKTLKTVGSKMDLEAKTDSLLAQWISKEKEASDQQGISTSDDNHAKSGTKMVVGNSGAQETQPGRSGIMRSKPPSR